MLLLLSPENFTEIPFQLSDDAFMEVSLSQLFDFSSGVVEDTFDYESISNQHKSRAIHFLSIKSMKYFVDGSLKEELWEDYVKLELLKSKAKENNLPKNSSLKAIKLELKKSIDEDKFVRNGDYLLLTRGDPKGYSFLELSKDVEERFGFVPNNQFIVARPRPAYEIINSMPSIEYLHKCVLGPLVDNYLSRYDENSEENDGKVGKKDFFDLKIKQQLELQEKANLDMTEELNFEVLNKKFTKKNRVSIGNLQKIRVRIPKSTFDQEYLLNRLKKFQTEYDSAKFKLLNMQEALWGSLTKIV